MNTLLPITTSGLMKPSGTDQSTRPETQDLKHKKDRLRKATKQFESLFMYQMLQSMRKTIQDNPLTKDGAFSDSFGKDTFTEMFDMHLAEKMSGNKRSISELLYNSLVKTIEPASEGTESNDDVGALRKKTRESIPLSRKQIRIESPPSQIAIPVKVKPLKNIDRVTATKRPVRDSIITHYGDIINDAAAANKIDSALICAVIKTESGGNPQAVSAAGARGLMQLMDSTAAELGVTSVFDPRQNISGGAKYLRTQLDRFGDPQLALAAYNAGPEAVAHHRGVPPFPETKAYVSRVMDAYTSYRKQMAGNEAKAVSHSGR